MKGSAIFDGARRYRYYLTRCWPGPNTNHHQVTFIMLNPSQANDAQDDPTIRACSQFAQAWGYSQLNVVNLFAYRTPKPSVLKQTTNPIGPDNDQYLLQAAYLHDFGRMMSTSAPLTLKSEIRVY